MYELTYKELSISVIHKKRLKNTYISISDDKKVLVKTASSSQVYLLELLNTKEAWIRKTLNKMSSYKRYDFKLEDEVLLFGQLYSLDTYEAENLRKRLNGIRISSKEKILQCYDAFYKSISITYVTQRVEYFSNIMNLNYELIKFRKMKSRWGSCSSKKVITFNTQLIKLEKEFIDYVVVHELAHLKHMNHSVHFHTLVDKYIHNSKDIRKSLKEVRVL